MSIEIQKKDKATILNVTEDLIGPHHATLLKNTLQKILDEEPHNVILNLSRVQMVNQQSWGALAHYAREFRPEGKDIKLVGLNPRLQEHFDQLLHLSEVLETYSTEDEAFASLSDNVSHVERNILWKPK